MIAKFFVDIDHLNKIVDDKYTFYPEVCIFVRIINGHAISYYCRFYEQHKCIFIHKINDRITIEFLCIGLKNITHGSKKVDFNDKIILYKSNKIENCYENGEIKGMIDNN